MALVWRSWLLALMALGAHGSWCSMAFGAPWLLALHGFWHSMALGADVMGLECGSEQWMDGCGMWRGCMASWLGCLVYKVIGAGILGQIVHSTR